MVAVCMLAMGLISSLALGCSGGEVFEGTETSPDARPVEGLRDECGNGIDDDGDGLLDEDCFCGRGESQSCFTGSHPNRLVGACGDGVQVCDAAESTEFGRWGACLGDTLPGRETCDGVDNDCNGAIDEGCPCTAGDMQPCGVEFVSEPCTGGIQTCQDDGAWSSCEGAIGPSPEACGPSGAGDGIDNDCDGMTDEVCDCSLEVCADGVDNDCDGLVDETACGFMEPLDGGGGADAGALDSGHSDAAHDAGPEMTDATDSGPEACVPNLELCGDGLDNDCDGVVDESCDIPCTVPPDFARLGWPMVAVDIDAEYVIGRTTDETFDIIVAGDDTHSDLRCGDTREADHAIAFRTEDPGSYEVVSMAEGVSARALYRCDTYTACGSSGSGPGVSTTGTFSFASRAGDRWTTSFEGPAGHHYRVHVRYVGP